MPVFNPKKEEEMLFKNTVCKSFTLSHEYLPPKRFVLKDGVENTAVIAKGGYKEPLVSLRRACIIPAGGFLLVDFGEELSGGLRLVFHKNEGKKIRIVLGESCAEALSSLGEFSSTNDHAVRDTVLDISSYGVLEYGNSGFRFAKICAEDGTVALMGLFARADYAKLPWLGSFESSDKRLNEIWRVAARTVHLCTQDVIYDGIKRDRLVWAGDMHPEAKASLALFGATDSLKRSLDLLKETTQKGAWMNGIPSYSLWWVIIQYELYMYSGDKDYLLKSIDTVLEILLQFAKQISQDGTINALDSFVDWSTVLNNSAKEAAFQSLAIIAYDRGGYLCQALGGEDFSAVAQSLLQYKKRLVRRVPWSINLHALALQVLSGQKNLDEAMPTLLKDTAKNISVFYGYYVLSALSLGGNEKHALDTVKKYWGAMLDLGATSFFENFDLAELSGDLPPLKIDTPPTEGYKNIYAEGGAHCYRGYRRSLCHGWSSGPLPWISEFLLGIKILEPGCKRVMVKPCLAGLSFIRGTYPTPYGNITVSVTKTQGEPLVEITAPDGVEIVR